MNLFGDESVESPEEQKKEFQTAARSPQHSTYSLAAVHLKNVIKIMRVSIASTLRVDVRMCVFVNM